MKFKLQSRSEKTNIHQNSLCSSKKVQLTSTDGAGGLEKETVSLVASLETALNVIPTENCKMYSIISNFNEMKLQQKFM